MAHATRQFTQISVLVVLLLSRFVVAADVGYLKVRASLSQVKLELDGQPLREIGGDWDFVEIPPGKHVLRATKEHFQPQSREILIEPGRVTSVQFDFAESTGFRVKQVEDVNVVKGYGDMTIVTDIPGASIRLNGRAVEGSSTPVTIEHLAQGEWTIEVELMGKKRLSTTVVSPGGLQVVRLFFNPDREREYKEEQERKEIALREAEKKAEAVRRAKEAEEELRKREAAAAKQRAEQESKRREQEERRLAALRERTTLKVLLLADWKSCRAGKDPHYPGQMKVTGSPAEFSRKEEDNWYLERGKNEHEGHVFFFGVNPQEGIELRYEADAVNNQGSFLNSHQRSRLWRSKGAYKCNAVLGKTTVVEIELKDEKVNCRSWTE